jgi:hypothetical protein
MSSTSASAIETLKRRLSPLGKQLLEEMLTAYLTTGQWPLLRTIHSKHDKLKTRETLLVLGGAAVQESEDHNSGNRYSLLLIGTFLTKRGATYFQWWVKLFEYLRHLYLTDPDKRLLSQEEVRQILKLSEKDAKTFGALASLRPFYERSSASDGWAIRVPDEVEDFPRTGSLEATVEAFFLRRVPLESPVYRADQIAPTPPLMFPQNGWTFSQPAAAPLGSVDVLKRRYQVFVSSTYDDLKVERQHVIQALLETKCFPTGMELFPASSFEQMELIKRLIDVCDYYIVIVAGRYGTVGKNGVSYTEQEFDYARSINKPIIGFYHRSVGSIAGEKLDRTDQARAQLEAFAAKVKSRTCRPWSSAEELGSAVKSAILNELEFNPQPGWIRADAVPSTELVDKLKQRVADLEEKLKRRPAPATTVPAEQQKSYEITFRLSYFHSAEAEGTEKGESVRKTEDLTVTRTLDQILVELSGFLEQPNTQDELSAEWSMVLATEGLRVVKERHGDECEFSDCELDRGVFERLLHSLTAKRYIRKELARSPYAAGPLFRLTPGGLQRVAELKAL